MSSAMPPRALRSMVSGIVLALAAVVALLTVAPPAHAQDGESIGGRLQAPGEDGNVPVVGAVLTVRTAEGSEVGTATSDENGEWLVPVPGPGMYEVEIDPDTLGDNVLRDPDKTVLGDLEIRTGQARSVIFPFGDAGTRTGFTERFLGATMQGLQFGLIIAMTAIGLSLIFGTTGLVNFAHGELVTFGAIMTWFLNSGQVEGAIGWFAAAVFGLFLAPLGLVVQDRVSDPRKLRSEGFNPSRIVALAGGWIAAWAFLTFVPGNIHLIPAALLGVLITAGVGAGLDRGLWRPLRQRRTGLITMLVISIGLSLAMRNGLQMWFGGNPQKYDQYTIQPQIDAFGALGLTPKDLTIIIVSLVSLVSVALLLQRTRIGKAMRAVANNRDLAESSGIDVQRVVLFVWVLGGGLAGLGGVLSAADENVTFLLGFRLLLLMFAGVILGGLGTAYGALVGSIVIGLIVEWSTLVFSPELKVSWALGVLILILLVRPQGILGQKERFG